MAAFDFYSIGHSNIAAERFVAMLQAVDIGAIADVRSTPASRFCPWFTAKNLGPLLQQARIDYQFYGDALGGRPHDPTLYRDGVADYEAMARQDGFAAGLTRLIGEASGRCGGRICLMCAERDPLDCHRCLLVARALAARGFSTGHILFDGAVEADADTERRLVAMDNAASDLLATLQPDRIAAAYRRRARAVAFRLPNAQTRATRAGR